MGFPILDILGFGTKLIDKLIPDPVAKAAAQLELLKLQQSGELELMKVEMSAILTEAQSTDPWTSRARPSFLYVMYLLILTAIPMGIVSAISSSTSINIANGFGAWLHAIPDDLWWLMGAGYLGYSASRTMDKKWGNGK